MTEPIVVDAEVEAEAESNGHGGEMVPVPTLAVIPQVEASELVARLDVIRQAQQTAMVKDVDYGVIPGTDKPTLYKPGAEKLNVLFQLDVQLVNEKIWGPGDHLTVESRATVYHAPTGSRLGYGEGLCTTRERKYAFRVAKLACPQCSAETVFRSKKDGEGFYCWAKKGGCGAKFAPDDQRIAGQARGDVENPDLPDLWNTVVKMAEKRARVDAVLAVTGASALFTQDVEDMVVADVPPPSPKPTAPPTAPPPPAAPPANLLDPARVETIAVGLGKLCPTYADVNLMLGACGLDGLRAASAKAIRERIASLTPSQADALEAEMERTASVNGG